MLRPWQDLVIEKLTSSGSGFDDMTREKAWYHLTNSYNSDSQWPPTLPEALVEARRLVGGIEIEKI